MTRDFTYKIDTCAGTGAPRSDSWHQLNTCLRGMVKLQRAHGGCLGDEKR